MTEGRAPDEEEVEKHSEPSIVCSEPSSYSITKSCSARMIRWVERVRSEKRERTDPSCPEEEEQ